MEKVPTICLEKQMENPIYCSSFSSNDVSRSLIGVEEKRKVEIA